MKKYLGLFLFVGVSINANAIEYGVGDYYVGSFDSADVIVNNNAVVSATSIDGILVDDVVVNLYNNGTINGPINTNGNTLHIYNNGQINGDIITSETGIATLIINSDAPITQVNFVGNKSYVVLNDVSNINFDSIKNINAVNFNIVSSSLTRITINDFQDWQNWDKNVTFDGPIELVINDKNTVSNDVVITNGASTNGKITQVQIKDLEDFYKVELEYTGTDVILHIVRETDYDKVFDDGSESLLETIREKHPNDKLLKKLDGLDNINQINRIKNRSYRFNHSILSRPVKVINNFALADRIHDETDSGAGFKPLYIMSDKMNDVGGRLHIGHSYDNIYFNAGINFNYFTYKDSLNDFSGFTYGLDFKAKEQFDNLWLNETVGITLAQFKADYIYSDNATKKNPLGLSGYGEVLAGYDINILPDLIIAPFGGLAYQRYKVLDAGDSDFYARAGTDVKYSFVMDGIKYEYSVSASAGSNGYVFSDLKVGFWSITDQAGASLDIGFFKNDFAYNYQLSATAKMLF